MRVTLPVLLAFCISATRAVADTSVYGGNASASMGELVGTVVWAGPKPKFPDEGCDVHAFDIEGHRDIDGGLSNVVVIAEPADDATKRRFRSRATGDHAVDITDPGELEWNLRRSTRVAATPPGVPLAVSANIKLRFYAGDKLLETLVPSSGEGHVVLSEQGIVKVVDDEGHLGWVYVTPYPTRISSGNCRFHFTLPQGLYRLHGWHPQAGHRSLTVDVSARTKVTPIKLLIFRGR